jgi:GPI mannosyltransferase 3
MSSAAFWSRERIYVALTLITIAGSVLRVLACFLEPPRHPDEYFQYLEPAWWHVTGAGLAAWEWDVGLRSWVLPSYNGAWMALLIALGIDKGATIGWFLKVHWALINASLIVIAWRGGCSVSRRLERKPRAPTLTRASMGAPSSLGELPAGWQGGLLAAALCATFPVLVVYAGHTLSELPSMLCLVAGLVLTAELMEHHDRESPQRMRKAALIGLLLSLGACLRIATGPLVLIAPIWLLVGGRLRYLLSLIAGALVPAIVFALVDRLTWGSFAGSFVAYVDFNFVQGGAADFGTEPPGWYLDVILRVAPFGLPLLLIAALLGVRSTWPFVVSAGFLITFLSTQPHKEERFIIAFWPLLLIAAGGTVGAWIAQKRATGLGSTSTGNAETDCASSRRSRAPRWLAIVLPIALLLGVVIEGTRSLYREETWMSQDRLTLQAWAGSQPDLTGLLVDEPISAGGYLWFGSKAPQLPFARTLLRNPIFSHVLVRSGSREERRARRANFEQVHRAGRFLVLRRAALMGD